MQTIEINNPDIERFITMQYGGDTDDLLSDFVKFVKSSMDDGYPSISFEEAKEKVMRGVQGIPKGEGEELSKVFDDILSR